MAKSRRSSETLGDHQHALEKALHDLPPVLVVEGPEAFLRRRAVDAFEKTLRRQFPAVDIATLQGGTGSRDASASVGQVLAELMSASLLSPEKLVLLRQADGTLNASETAARGKTDPITQMIQLLGSWPSRTWLLVECDKLPRNRKLGKALAETALIPCPALTRAGEVGAFCRVEAKALGKELEPGVSDLLFASHGGNLGAVQGDLEKLSIFVGDRSAIGVEDLQAFLSGSLEFDVFGLTNAVEARDLASALTFARRVLTHGLRGTDGKRGDAEGSARRALSMLSGTMESILEARIAAGSEGGSDAGSVAAAVGVSPWRAEKLLNAARRYPIGELRRILTQLAEISRSINDTGSDVSLSLERAVLACCRREAH